jgi:ribA/ribD-fused uncharacterized protein
VKTEPILAFLGEYHFLSNFYRVQVEYDGLTYPSSEHAYQAAKTSDPGQRKEIRGLRTAGEAKKYGGRKGPIRLRQGWDGMKIQIMRDVLWAKFTQNNDLAEMLLATGDAELVEGNDWGDKFWGRVNGHGENWLGKILVETRTKLRKTP